MQPPTRLVSPVAASAFGDLALPVIETPEQKTRHDIDAKLIASGWLVQDRDDLDLTAGRGIAVREFPMKSGFGFADYLLYLDRKAHPVEFQAMLRVCEALRDHVKALLRENAVSWKVGYVETHP